MKVTIIWRNLFPFPEDTKDLEKTKEVEIEDPFTTTPANVEKQAVLDTPAGYFLFQILFPGITFRYTKQGKKTVKRDIDNLKLT